MSVSWLLLTITRFCLTLTTCILCNQSTCYTFLGRIVSHFKESQLALVIDKVVWNKSPKKYVWTIWKNMKSMMSKVSGPRGRPQRLSEGERQPQAATLVRYNLEKEKCWKRENKEVKKESGTRNNLKLDIYGAICKSSDHTNIVWRILSAESGCFLHPPFF